MQLTDRTKTCFARATPAGRSAIAVVRVSGPRTHAVVNALTRGRPPKPRVASVRKLYDGDAILDEALVLIFEAGRSFTGDDSAEFHLHGSPHIAATLEMALERLGAEPAPPGWFTQCAINNRRLDLSQAAGLIDLIDADSAAAQRRALRSLNGELGRLAEGWRSSLLAAASLLETGIDFVDEDLGDDLVVDARSALGDVQTGVATELAALGAPREDRSVLEIALIGPPNAGKSTLLNAVAGWDAAIVSDRPGTTRDLVRIDVVLDGRTVRFIDTAGLRDSDDAIEVEGVRRSQRAAEEADGVVCVVSVDTVDDLTLNDSMRDRVDLVLWSKSDLAAPSRDDASFIAGAASVVASARDGTAVGALFGFARDIVGKAGDGSTGVARDDVRRRCFTGAEAALTDAIAAVDAGRIELASEATRRAADALAPMIGGTDNEDMLDALFSRFCIGK